MYNELLKIGPITIYGYGLMTAIGIISAYFSLSPLDIVVFGYILKQTAKIAHSAR